MKKDDVARSLVRMAKEIVGGPSGDISEFFDRRQISQIKKRIESWLEVQTKKLESSAERSLTFKADGDYSKQIEQEVKYFREVNPKQVGYESAIELLESFIDSSDQRVQRRPWKYSPRFNVPQTDLHITGDMNKILSGVADVQFGRRDLRDIEHALNSFIRDVSNSFDKEIDVDITASTEFGNVNVRVPSEIIAGVSGLSNRITVTLRPIMKRYNSWQDAIEEGMRKELFNNKSVNQKTQKTFIGVVNRRIEELKKEKVEYDQKQEEDERRQLLRMDNDKLLKMFAPKAHNWTQQYGYSQAIYNLAMSGKTGTFTIEEGRNLISEERHWAEYQDYEVTISIGRANSDKVEDLMSDSRLFPKYSLGNTYGVEV